MGLAVAATIVIAVVAWLRPEWEIALGRPSWAHAPALKWLASIILAASVLLIAVAQMQMGVSWRVGVPAEGRGALVAHGLFRWSRNPIFVGMIGVLVGVFLGSPHIGSAAVLAATSTLVVIQVRIEEEAPREKHGEDYERYAREVPRWFGWLARRSRPSADLRCGCVLVSLRLQVTLPPTFIQPRLDSGGS